MTAPDDIIRLTEVFEQLGAAREKLRVLDVRELEHFTTLDGHVQGVAAAVDELSGKLAELAMRVGDLAGISDDDDDPDKPYAPRPSARWWDFDEQERTAAVARIAKWVRSIYRPGYGHLAALLPSCWAQHDLALYSLDTVSELWMVLYLNPKRSPSTLAGQVEFQTRVLPLYAAQMQAEAKGCEHAAGRSGR